MDEQRADERFVLPKHPISIDAAEGESGIAQGDSVPSPAGQQGAGVIIPVESSVPEGAKPVVQALPVLLFEREQGADAADVSPKPKKSHRGLKIALIVIVAVIVVLGVFAYTQYRALMRVVDELQADGAAISATVSDISTSVQNMDFDAMLVQVQDMRSTIAHMRERISTREFDVASKIPTYGGDVLTLRSMLDTALDAADNAAIPLLSTVVDHPLSSLVSRENGIDVAGVYAIVDAAEAAIPVAETDLDALEALDGFAIPQLAEATKPVFENLPLARRALSTAKALLGQYKPMLDSLVGRDGSGLAVQFWGLLSLFLPEGEITLESLMELIETFSGFSDGNGGIDLDAIIERLFGGGEDSSGGGFSFDSLWPFIGMLFGGAGGNGLGGDTFSLDTLLPFIGLLFGDGLGDQDSSGSDADPGESLDIEEGVETIVPLIDLLLGDGTEENPGLLEGLLGEDGEGIGDLFGLLFGDGFSNDAEYAA